MTYAVGPFEGATTCIPGDARACHALWGAPVTGLGYIWSVGDTGTLYELEVGGYRFVIDVDGRDDATDIAVSLEFAVVHPSAAPPDSEPLPFVGPHTAGATYYTERISAGVYTLTGVEGIAGPPSFLRDPFILLQHEGETCLSIADGAVAAWSGQPARDKGPLSDIPDDVIGALGALETLHVVSEPMPFPLGDVIATAVDVEPAGSEDIEMIDMGLTVPVGEVTRVVVVPTGGERAPDLLAAYVGTACEQVLASVTFVPSGGS